TAVDLKALGERQVIIDCDVIKADGGTRTASITGGFVALSLAFRNMIENRQLTASPIKNAVVAVSAGIFENNPVLDLDYAEDSKAEVDTNFVFNDQGHLIEVQGTGEARAFTKEEFNQMLELAEKGAGELIRLQRKILMPNMG
ncbi:MAG: ribonuclease PH, partial [Alphaproteobacteria bacterium]|nr:ribonuclease PH [Alphaproteobacteria bacterium]